MKRNYINIYDKYKNYLYSYNYPKMNYSNNVNCSEVPVNTDNGYIELFVFTDRGHVPVEGAVVTVYTAEGDSNAAKVMRFLTTTNPIIIELPVAHTSGSLIKGPEYYFSTYNMTIEKPDFYTINVKNIRLFPGITVQFNYNLNSTLPGVPGRQETIAIPPHPRDAIQ